jgi:hypothetical protein
MKKIRCLRILFKKKIFCNTLFYGSGYLLLFFFLNGIHSIASKKIYGEFVPRPLIFSLLYLLSFSSWDANHSHERCISITVKNENLTTDSFPFWCCIFLQSHRDCDAAVWPFLLIWKLMPGSLELYSVLYCIDLLRWSFHHEVMLDIHKFQILITFKRWNFSPYLKLYKNFI